MPTSRSSRALVAAVLAVAVGALATPAHAHPHPSRPTGGTSRSTPGPDRLVVASAPILSPASRHWPIGIDVASHQHPDGAPIDWGAVRRSGISFAIVKVDEGPVRRGRYVNPWFRPDWDGARDAGLLVGPYHYARPRRPVHATADADARAFVATVGPSIRTAAIPPVLDLEEAGDLGPAETAAWAGQWLDTTATLTGRTPVLYTGLGFWTEEMAGTPALAGHPLWVARYGATPGLLPGGWTEWSFWQFSDRGRVPGVATEVDVNLSCGLVTELVGECRAPTYAAWAAARWG